MPSRSVVHRESKNFTSDHGIRPATSIPIAHEWVSRGTAPHTHSSFIIPWGSTNAGNPLLGALALNHGERGGATNRPVKGGQRQVPQNKAGCTARPIPGHTTRPRQITNYERFKRSNIKVHTQSWYYRGCWHQTGPLL